MSSFSQKSCPACSGNGVQFQPETVSSFGQNTQILLEKSHQGISEALNDLAEGTRKRDQRLPLFFFLDQTDQRGWRNITTVDITNALGGEMPANLFRHNMLSSLAGQLDQDIIDQVAGHQIYGLPSHGITSSRTLHKDHQNFRAIVSGRFDVIIHHLKFHDFAIDQLARLFTEIKLSTPDEFGIGARLKAQEKNEHRAHLHAKIISDEALRQLAGLITSKEFSNFIRNRPDIVPDGDISTRSVELAIQIMIDREPDRVKLNSRRIYPPTTPTNSSLLFESIDFHNQICTTLNSDKWTVPTRSQKLNRLIAIIRMVYLYGVCQERIIKSLVQGNWSIYAHKQRVYISLYQCTVAGRDEKQQEFERIQIDKITYDLLIQDLPSPQACEILTEKQKEILKNWFSNCSEGFIHLTTLQAAITEIVKYRQEYNRYFFPGILSGALNGEFQTWCESKDSLVFRIEPESRLLKPTDPLKRERFGFELIGKSLNDEKEDYEKIDSVLKNLKNLDRGEVRRELTNVSATNRSNSNPALLADYIVFLLGRKNTRSSRELLSKSSILRYSLSIKKFLRFCGQSKVVECEYWELIEIRNTHLRLLTPITAQSECIHINEFLRYSLTKSGFSLPLWLQFDDPKPRDTIIGEAQYELIFFESEISEKRGERNKDLLKITFLLAYLYGLRSGEIQSLKCTDFILQKDFPVILLHRSGNEALKTVNSNRKILPWRLLNKGEKEALTRQLKISSLSKDNFLFPKEDWPHIYSRGLDILSQIAPALDYHCLRDSRITHQISNLFSFKKNTKLSTRALISGRVDGSKIEGHAISKQIGHADFKTTLESYAKNVLTLAISYATSDRDHLILNFDIDPSYQIKTKKTDYSIFTNSRISTQYPLMSEIFYEVSQFLFNDKPKLVGFDFNNLYSEAFYQFTSLANRLPVSLNPCAINEKSDNKRSPKVNKTFFNWAISQISNSDALLFWSKITDLENSTGVHGLFQYVSNRVCLFANDTQLDINRIVLIREVLSIIYGEHIANRLQIYFGRNFSTEQFEHSTIAFDEAYSNHLVPTRKTKRNNDLSTSNFLTSGLRGPYYVLRLNHEGTPDSDRIYFDKTCLLVSLHFINFCLFIRRTIKPKEC